MSLFPQAVIDAIQSAKTIDCVTHVHPDGDAIGSELALVMALKKLGKTVRVVNADPPPQSLQFLPGTDMATLYREGLTPADLLIAIEVPDAKRMGPAKALLGATKGVLNIDHHPTNTLYGTWNIMDEKAAAVGEMVYQLIGQLASLNQGRSLMDADIAAGLYAAILTDTGRFGYSSTSPATHRITAELLGFGLRPYDFVKQIYETSSAPRLALLAKSLATLQVSAECPVAWIRVSHAMFQETGTTSEDTEGFVDYPRSVTGMEVAVLLREDEPGVVKVSLRSVNEAKVSGIAQAFGGGGHDKAAGCLVRGSLDDVEKKILSAVKAQLKIKNKE